MDEPAYALLRFYLCLTSIPQTRSEQMNRLHRLAYWRKMYALYKGVPGEKPVPLLFDPTGKWVRVNNKPWELATTETHDMGYQYTDVALEGIAEVIKNSRQRDRR